MPSCRCCVVSSEDAAAAVDNENDGAALHEQQWDTFDMFGTVFTRDDRVTGVHALHLLSCSEQPNNPRPVAWWHCQDSGHDGRSAIPVNAHALAFHAPRMLFVWVHPTCPPPPGILPVVHARETRGEPQNVHAFRRGLVARTHPLSGEEPPPSQPRHCCCCPLLAFVWALRRCKCQMMAALVETDFDSRVPSMATARSFCKCVRESAEISLFELVVPACRMAAAELEDLSEEWTCGSWVDQRLCTVVDSLGQMMSVVRSGAQQDSHSAVKRAHLLVREVARAVCACVVSTYIRRCLPLFQPCVFALCSPDELFLARYGLGITTRRSIACAYSLSLWSGVADEP